MSCGAPAADVLVVGDGLAGMAAALEAAAAGASIMLVSAGSGASPLAQGGIAAAVGGDDSPALHAADTLAAGAGLSDPEAAGAMTAEAPAAVRWLAAHGVAFDTGPDGSPALALEAAHSRRRVLHAAGDGSGAAIAAALRHALAAHPAPVRRVEARLDALLVGEGGLAGARLVGAGGPRDVAADAVVLATGGYAGLFDRTTTAPGCDGSGLLAALAAGATLADLEFVQFHPTAYAGPGGTFLVTEALRGAGGRVVDGRGRRFLLDVDRRGELAPRAVVARAIAEHLRMTGRPYVLLDVRHLGGRLLARDFPGFTARCRRVGLDPARDPVPIAPAAHYSMGGVATDLCGRTGVPGLLAAGECARTGVHGGNRLASNSLLEAVVFGRRAGRAATEDAGRASLCGAALPAGERPSGGELSLTQVRAHLGRGAGPLREAAGLGTSLRVLSAAAGTSPAAEDGRRLACLVLQAALARQESRGAHVRTDHPGEAAAWTTLEVAVRRGSRGLELRLANRGEPARNPPAFACI